MRASMTLSERWSQWWRHAVCRAVGHAKAEQRMFARICSRCREVVR